MATNWCKPFAARPAVRWNSARAASYPILHRLEADGLLGGKRETTGGRSRVVYRVTAKGSKRLAGSTASWQKIVEAISQALHGGEHGEPALA